MMKRSVSWLFVLCTVLLFSACEVVGAIFKAGMLWGILLVVLLVVTVIALISKEKK